MVTLLEDARRGHRGLLGFAVAMAVAASAFALLATVDPVLVMGQLRWIKPFKFAISFVAYCGTLAWMLGQLEPSGPGRRPPARRTGWALVGAGAVEMLIITGQAARGQQSHFNETDTLGAILFSVMGATVLVLYVGTILVGLRFLREPGRDPAFGSAIRFGLLSTVLGMSVGIVMVLNHAHAVGVPDGGPGLPLLGWSTTGGDLRIGHFVGLHGLQVLPILAAGLTLLAGRIGPRPGRWT